MYKGIGGLWQPMGPIMYLSDPYTKPDLQAQPGSAPFQQPEKVKANEVIAITNHRSMEKCVCVWICVDMCAYVCMYVYVCVCCVGFHSPF